MSTLIQPFAAQHEDLLRDESRKTGRADSVAFPTSEAELIEVVTAVAREGGTLTTQGARTGITASGVPQEGTIVNLSRMKAMGEVCPEAGGTARLTVQPGVLLEEIRSAVDPHGLFFPPDPTETSASIGGMVSCNASGAMSFRYGATRNWIQGLRVVLSNGSVLSLKRGQARCRGRRFQVETEDGRLREGLLPSYRMPKVKSAAGYYAAPDMDLIDLFIGMEGTLGILSEIELKLIAKPAFVAGVTAFLPSEAAALEFVRKLRAGDDPPVAIEFFNHHALNMMREAREHHTSFGELPELPDHFDTAVYVEFHASDDDAIDEHIVSTAECVAALGGSEDDCWCATTAHELERLKAFRHATPELVNLTIDERRKRHPELTKLGTDMSVPDDRLDAAMRMYNEGLAAAGLESVIFGHIGNNHVHVNIIPKDMEEYEAGKQLYLAWARAVVAMGGSVSAEHGIGKIKVPFLELMYGREGVEEMKRVKALFDTGKRLNRGTLFRD